MSRVLLLNLSQSAVMDQCANKNIGVSAIEPLASGGVRMVCISVDGAEEARRVFKSKILKGEVTRTKYRPSTAF